MKSFSGFTQLQALLILVIVLSMLVVGIQNFGTDYHATFTKLLLINIMLAVSLTGTNGLTGIFSLAHPAFMMIGAYTAVIFAYPIGRRGFAMPDLPELISLTELPLWGSALTGATVAALVAVIIGLVVLRLSSHYLAVASLALIMVVKNIALNLDGITRGGRGLTGIPRESTLVFVALSLLVVIVFFWQLKHVSTGRAMLAIRENELAARCFGISPFRTKLLSFAMGAFVAGYAGALIPHVVGVMTPGSFGLALAFNLVAITVVGGQGSIIGAILGTMIFKIGTEAIRPLEESTGYYGLAQILIAATLILILIFRPRGLFGLKEPLVRDR